MSITTKEVSRWLFWALMGLVMVGLIGFGSFNFGKRATALGSVGDTEISADRYYREVNAQLNAIQAQTGKHMPFAQAQAFGVDRAALQTVINQVALENESARLGVSVGDDQVAKRIRDISAFAGPDGKFNRDTYDFVLKQSGLTPKDFEQSLRSEVARTILQSAVSNGVAMPASYTDTLYGWVREARDFTWAKLDASVLSAPVGLPGDAALSAYYDAHPADFTLPATRKITYAWLRPEDVIDQIDVSDDELRKLYDSRIDEFKKPERRLVERLVFGTEAEAQAAAKRISDGTATFDDIVAERGLTLDAIDLGDVAETDLGDAGPAVFAIDKPGIVGPATSDLGPALFRMNAILPAQETSFEDAKAGLKADYAADAARRKISDMVNDLDDALAGGATLEDLGKEYGMTLAQIDWTGTESDGIAAYDNFRTAANAVQDGDYPEIKDLSDGGVFALRLDKTIASRLQTLDEVQAAATAGWQHQETLARVADRAKAMIAEIKAGKTPAGLGLTETTEKGQTRDGFIDGTPKAMMEQVFGLAAAGDWAVVPDADGAILVRLDAIHPADQTSDNASAIKAKFAQSADQALSLDVLQAFSAALEDSAGITLNQAMINSVNANFQ